MRPKKRAVLIINGERFHSTSTSKKFLEETLEFLKKEHRYIKGVIKPFYVDIQRFYLTTKVVIQWGKKKGFSLWFHPIGVLDKYKKSPSEQRGGFFLFFFYHQSNFCIHAVIESH